MKEKRQYIRIPDSSKISYRIIPQSKMFNFITHNISQDGIRFYTHDFLPVNSLLKVKVKIKKLHFAFEATVKVHWVKKDPHKDRYEIGVSFSNIPKEAIEHLIKYIRLSIKKTT